LLVARDTLYVLAYLSNAMEGQGPLLCVGMGKRGGRYGRREIGERHFERRLVVRENHRASRRTCAPPS
jgi:hypothetical protein